ncbi:integrase arm-type DNA-binding domain-containing protein [Seonamhaeicola sp. MEBiC1930]|uniref:tyrosine-type recombinase/integrase n=1 Tax=Seonamhaeicola sp. MEBiC01930 TaxID=2976768 RepID=UPI003252ED8F
MKPLFAGASFTYKRKQGFIEMHISSQNDTSIASPNASPIRSKNKNSALNHIKYTDLSIKRLKAKASRVIYWFEGYNGFGIRVTPKNRKSWVYIYRFNNRPRMMTLGKYPRMSLSEARKAYTESDHQVQMGFDPAQKKVDENQFEREADTIKDLLERYIEYSRAQGKKSWKTEESQLRKNVIPVIGHMKAHHVKRRHLMPIFHDMIVKRNAPIGAKHLFAYTRRMFNIAVMWDLMEYNPCIGLKLGIKSNKRQRHLTPREIFEFWHMLDNAGTAMVIRLALRFMLCTACRGVEVRIMEWEHLDLDAMIWTIPKTKNKKMHRVYLHGQAKLIIEQVKYYTGNSKYVFGSMRHEKIPDNPPVDLNHLGQTSLSRAINNNRKLLDMEEFKPHDLRRTSATLAAGLGCPRQWVKILLNHTDNDITGIYDQYAYDWERNKVSEVLNFAISRIVSCFNIDQVPTLLELRDEVREKGIYKREF